MKIDDKILDIYNEIEQETGIPIEKIDKILTGYYKVMSKIMKTTADGKFYIPFFGFFVFDALRSDNGTKQDQKNKIEQKRKADKVISIYELTGIKR